MSENTYGKYIKFEDRSIELFPFSHVFEGTMHRFNSKAVSGGYYQIERGQVRVYGRLNSIGLVSDRKDKWLIHDLFNKKKKICKTCGDTGEVAVDEAVYPGEGHMASVGSRPCPDCKGEEDDFSGATEGDR